MDSFEWDEEKWLANIKRRGVDFQRAAAIFVNPVIETQDERNDYRETRIRALGHVDDDFFIVVYTWRGENRRIISAWKVGERGKRRYTAILSRRN